MVQQERLNRARREYGDILDVERIEKLLVQIPSLSPTMLLGVRFHVTTPLFASELSKGLIMYWKL